MTKRRLASYGLNLVGVTLLYAAITLTFTFNAWIYRRSRSCRRAR